MELTKRNFSNYNINKKGIFFTLITIVILTIFATSYTTYTLYQDRSSINSRITTLNNFVSSVEQDLPRQIYISGYRAILLLDKQVINSGVYLSDINTLFPELFFNATLDGVNQDLMTDATFSNMENFFSSSAQNINANLSLLNPTIIISQSDPWNLEITFNTTLIINDKGNLASWNKSTSIVIFVPLANFNDPIYAVNTAGKVLIKVNQTPYQTFVTGADYTNLTNHFQNSLYKASTSAPNFLMRLQGNLSASPTGIESLVNPQSLADVGMFAEYKSVVDYIYFSTSDPAAYTVPAVNNLILDDEDNHLEIYNVSGVAVPA